MTFGAHNVFVPRHFYPRDVVSGVFTTATWLAGCLSQPVLHQND